MDRRWMAAVAAMLAVVLGAGPAFAGIDAIRNANNQLTMDLISTTVDYGETGNGILGTRTGLLDTEKGAVPGYAVELSAMGRLMFDDTYLDLRYSHVDGHTRYVGAPATGGTYGSVVGSDAATLSDYRARFGAGIGMGGDFMLTPYAELGHHRWFRGVNYGESYRHSYWGLGALAQSEIVSGLVLSGHLTLGRTFSSHIAVAGPNGFSDGLGNAVIYDAGLAGDYALGMGMHMNVGADWNGFQYGMSSLHPITGGYTWEPDSKTRYMTLSAGVGYAF